MFIDSKVFIAFQHLIRTCSKSAKLFGLHTPGKPHDLSNYDQRNHEIVIIPNISTFKDVGGATAKLIGQNTIDDIMEIVKDARNIGFTRYDLILGLSYGGNRDIFNVRLHHDSLEDNYLQWVINEVRSYWGTRQPIAISTKELYPEVVDTHAGALPLPVSMVYTQLSAYGVRVDSANVSKDVVFVIS